MVANNPNFDTLLSTTLNNYRKTLTDNVFRSRVLLWWLTEKNSVRKLSGGIKIVEPLIYAAGQAGSYGEWDSITIIPQEGMTAAEYPWRQLFASIAMSGLEEAQNNGEEAIINLLKAKIMQAEETLKTSLNVMLYANTAGASKDFYGLGLLLGQTGTVGNIDSADAANVWWRTPVVPATGLAAGDFRKKLGNAYNQASNGNDTVDGIFMSQNDYERYESELTPNVRYQDVKSANAGFTSLLFKQCPVYWDRDAAQGTTYGLNSKYINLVGHTQRWFKQSPFSDGLSAVAGGNATTVDARYSLITTYGNLTINNRRNHFIVNAIPAFT